MKKIFAVLSGLSLATAGLSLAAQTTPAPAGNHPATTVTTKKHVKKAKKSAKPAAGAATTPTPAGK